MPTAAAEVDAEQELASLCGVLNTSYARLVTVAAQALADESWAGGGIRSPEHWLTLRAGLSPHRARTTTSATRPTSSSLGNVETALEQREASEARRSTEPVPAEVRHALGRVESETARMGRLVDDLLLLARLDAGRPLEQEDVDLSRLVIEVTDDARVAGPDHRWSLDLPDEPLVVRGDEHRLHQVVANLLSNARTHTPAGTSVVVRLSADPQAYQVLLSVSDDGPGIPAELQANVFERFVRADDSRSRVVGSTGLGLSIAHAVVKTHRGSLTLTSAKGRTEFRIALPARPADRHTAGSDLPSSALRA